MDDILQIKREHITEPIKRSIKIYGNKPQRLALILNMAITELVLLISKMLEAARAIRNKILHTDVTNAEKTDFASNIVVDNTDNTSAIENMNEFYLSYKESQNAYAEYQQEVDDWKKSNDNAETPIPNGQCPDGYPPTGHTGKQRKRQCHDSPFPFPESAAIEMPFRPRDHISKPHDRMRDCPGIPKGQIQQITRNQGKNNQPHLIHKALI